MSEKDRNLMAALTYLFSWVTGLIIFLVEKKDRYVRFHAIQSILLGIAFLVVAFALMTVSVIVNVIPVLGCLAGILTFFMGFGLFVVYVVLSLYMMYEAYEGRKHKLPVIGDMAEKNA